MDKTMFLLFVRMMTVMYLEDKSYKRTDEMN